MAKKKSRAVKTKSTSHWHRHHSFSSSLAARPFLTMGITLMIFLLLAVIWLTLFVQFNYNLEVSSNTINQQMLLHGK